jgi:hypothetical protein
MKTFNGKVMVAVFGFLNNLIFSLPIYALWNSCLVGSISGINKITLIHAWGILVLIDCVVSSLNIDPCLVDE